MSILIKIGATVGLIACFVPIANSSWKMRKLSRSRIFELNPNEMTESEKKAMNDLIENDKQHYGNKIKSKRCG